MALHEALRRHQRQAVAFEAVFRPGDGLQRFVRLAEGTDEAGRDGQPVDGGVYLASGEHRCQRTGVELEQLDAGRVDAVALQQQRPDHVGGGEGRGGDRLADDVLEAIDPRTFGSEEGVRLLVVDRRDGDHRHLALGLGLQQRGQAGRAEVGAVGGQLSHHVAATAGTGDFHFDAFGGEQALFDTKVDRRLVAGRQPVVEPAHLVGGQGGLAEQREQGAGEQGSVEHGEAP